MLFSAENYLLVIPLALAVGIGWWLGKRECKRASGPISTNLSNEYFTGLDYLLNEKMDEAIESFIRALEINSDTIPAHIALAKLFRRKGDVDRAIKIHQNLLARPDLSRNDFMRVQMALARDYYAVGLLDRAENLLQEIIKTSSKSVKAKAITLLIKLYEKEGEWQSALNAAEMLSPDAKKDIANELSHYCCELAEECVNSKRTKQAGEFLKKASVFDSANVRVSLQQAYLDMGAENWKQAVKHLKSVGRKDKLFVSETIPYMKTCCEKINSMGEFESYLRLNLGVAASTSVIIALADLIKQEKGVYAAGSFITEELKRRPSIKGFNSLIDLHIEYGSDSAKDSLSVLRGLTGQLEISKPIYRCNSCGFSGRTLAWQCPSCKNWGATKPIQGLEGE